MACPTDLLNLSSIYANNGYALYWNTPNPNAADTGTYRLIAINNNGCSDTVTVIVGLDVAQWTGATSNNWHTASNWNIGKVPTDLTHVIIPAATPNACVLKDANAVAASIQVKPGADLQVINGRLIELKGKCLSLPAN